MSLFTQSESLNVDNTTIKTEDSTTNNTIDIVSILFNNDSSCEPDCIYILSKPNYTNTETDNDSLTKIVCSFLAMILVITICIVIILRRSKIQQKKNTESIQNQIISAAHPFEEIVIINDQTHESIQLSNINSTASTK